MAGTIQIDMNTVRNANYALPSIQSIVSGVGREVSMLRWRIPDEVLDERDIRIRLEAITRDIERVERKLSDIYGVTANSVSQYINLEERITENANRFE